MSLKLSVSSLNFIKFLPKHFVNNFFQKSFDSLTHLDLFNNEICNLDDYRTKVFKLLPSLKYLDEQDADENDEEEDDSDGEQNGALSDEEEDDGKYSYLQYSYVNNF